MVASPAKNDRFRKRLYVYSQQQRRCLKTEKLRYVRKKTILFPWKCIRFYEIHYSAIMFYLLLQMASDKSGSRCGPRQYSSTEW